jgi:hypothetical protein
MCVPHVTGLRMAKCRQRRSTSRDRLPPIMLLSPVASSLMHTVARFVYCLLTFYSTLLVTVVCAVPKLYKALSQRCFRLPCCTTGSISTAAVRHARTRVCLHFKRCTRSARSALFTCTTVAIHTVRERLAHTTHFTRSDTHSHICYHNNCC